MVGHKWLYLLVVESLGLMHNQIHAWESPGWRSRDHQDRSHILLQIWAFAENLGDSLQYISRLPALAKREMILPCPRWNASILICVKGANRHNKLKSTALKPGVGQNRFENWSICHRRLWADSERWRLTPSLLGSKRVNWKAVTLIMRPQFTVWKVPRQGALC